MTEPTPGPWRAIIELHAIEVRNSGPTPVVNWMGFDDSFRERGEHEANARLIAAAPALLAACLEANKYMADIAIHGKPIGGVDAWERVQGGIAEALMKTGLQVRDFESARLAQATLPETTT